MIYIVRHGQDLDNAMGILNGRRNMPLTELGRKQAEEVAKKFVDKDISYIYSTPLKRGVQTAEIICQKIGLSVARLRIHIKLIERDFGVLTGMPYSAIPKLGRNFLYTDHTNYFLEADKAETFPMVLARAKDVLNEAVARHKDENGIFVCHGDIGNMIKAAYYGWEFQKALLHGKMDNCEIHALPDPDMVLI